MDSEGKPLRIDITSPEDMESTSVIRHAHQTPAVIEDRIAWDSIAVTPVSKRIPTTPLSMDNDGDLQPPPPPPPGPPRPPKVYRPERHNQRGRHRINTPYDQCVQSQSFSPGTEPVIPPLLQHFGPLQLHTPRAACWSVELRSPLLIFQENKARQPHANGNVGVGAADVGPRLAM